jgi:hypothetical protein
MTTQQKQKQKQQQKQQLKNRAAAFKTLQSSNQLTEDTILKLEKTIRKYGAPILLELMGEMVQTMAIDAFAEETVLFRKELIRLSQRLSKTSDMVLRAAKHYKGNR